MTTNLPAEAPLSISTTEVAAQPTQVQSAPPGLNWFVLVQLILCVVPALLCVGFSQPVLGAGWLFSVLFLLLARYLVFGKQREYAALAVGALPALMVLRGFFFYNALLVIFGLGIVLWVLAAPQEFRQLWRRWRWRWLLLLGLVYWGVSFIRTGNYYENLRTLELVLSVSLLCLLAVRRSDLGTALLGAGLTSFVLGLALLPHGERVGEAVVDDYRLGNPITFGIPLALLFLLTIADGGKWLLLEKRRALRLAAGGLMGALLILSGSRGSWLVVAAGLLVLLGGRRERVMVLAMLLMLIPITAGLLATGRGEAIERMFERTFSSERTWSQSTSGRADQWLLFPTAFWDSPFYGFGPGSGPQVHAQYSLRDPRGLSSAGAPIAWHALYLQLGIETGALGLLLLFSLLLPLLLLGLVHWRLGRESAPLLGVVSFLMIGLSVTALDAVSGLALGMGFLSKGRLKIRGLK